MKNIPRKPIKWIGSSKKDLDKMPADVQESKLMELVAKLGHAIKIVIGPAKRRSGKVELEFA